MTSRPRAARIKVGKARLAEMIEAATVDCYNESELTTGWLTMRRAMPRVATRNTARIRELLEAEAA